MAGTVKDLSTSLVGPIRLVQVFSFQKQAELDRKRDDRGALAGSMLLLPTPCLGPVRTFPLAPHSIYGTTDQSEVAPSERFMKSMDPMSPPVYILKPIPIPRIWIPRFPPPFPPTVCCVPVCHLLTGLGVSGYCHSHSSDLCFYYSVPTHNRRVRPSLQTIPVIRHFLSPFTI